MNKISIKINKETLFIKKYVSKPKDIIDVNETINKTNLIDIDNMYFSYDYIINNLDLMRNFLKGIIRDKQIKNIVASDMFHSNVLLFILDKNIVIERYRISSEEALDYENFKLLYEHKLIKEIEIYTLFNFMFLKLSELKKVNLREEFLCYSDIMNDNDMFTYSNIFYNRELLLSHKLSNDEKSDLDMYFKINRDLTLVSITKDYETNIKLILEKLKQRNLKYIVIRIYYELTENIVDLLDRSLTDYNDFMKTNKIKIKVIYNKAYKRKYGLKQVNMNIFRACLLVIIISCSIFLVVLKTKYEHDENKSNKLIDHLLVSKDKIIGNSKYLSSTDVVRKEHEEVDIYFQKFNKLFDKLKKENSDTVGWIEVKNTKINFPVVQAKDNEYYLNHDFNHRRNLYGWIFMDYRNNQNYLDHNTILYGHQDKHGLMFSTLNKTMEPSWYKNSANEIIEFSTPNRIYKFRVFSIYITESTNDYLINVFNDNKSKLKFFNDLKARSIYDFKVNLDENDKIITLSTCHGDVNRLVLHAKLIN